jgi:6-phosphogluconolactonase
MKWFIISALVLWVDLNAFCQPEQIKDLYVGTFTSEGAEGIYICSFNTGNGELTEKEILKGIDNPNFLKKSADGRFLYVVSSSPQTINPEGGNLSAYRIRDNGSLAFINKQSSHGDDPCYVDVSTDNKYAVVANYGGGSVVLFPVSNDGSLQPASSVIQHAGSGPNKERQSKAFAHSIRFSTQDDLLYAADLGTDKLYAYKIDRSGNRLIPADPPYAILPPGSGPRHFDFSDDGKYCFVANELNSSVTVFQNKEGRMSEIQTISTLPSDFKGISYCADIHISRDGKLVYVSNRGHNSIVVFNREADGKLSPVKFVPTEGNWPRNFVLDPSGRYMLVANQRSNNITIFRLDSEIPVFTGKEVKIPAPVCLEFR